MQVACLACYCYGLDAANANHSLVVETAKSEAARKTCKPFASNDTGTTAISVAISLVIIVINYVFQSLMAALANFELHKSHTEHETALCSKIVTALYINSAIIPLIASAYINWLAVIFNEALFKEGYPDFTTNWCVQNIPTLLSQGTIEISHHSVC